MNKNQIWTPNTHNIKSRINNNNNNKNEIGSYLKRCYRTIARLSKAKSTTHDFAQAIVKKLLKQKVSYPIS